MRRRRRALGRLRGHGAARGGPQRAGRVPARSGHDDLGPRHRRRRRRRAAGRPSVEAGGTLLDVATPGTSASRPSRSSAGCCADVVPRDELVLVASSPAGRGRRAPRCAGRPAGGLLAALDDSLLRLGVDYVDLWQLHGWDDAVPLEEMLAAVRHRRRRGRARYVGVSNLPGWQTAAGGGLAARLARPGAAGRPPRWSTRCSSAAWSARCVPACEWRRARRARVVAAGPGRADRQVPARRAVGLPRRLAAPARASSADHLDRRGRPDRGGGGHRRRGTRHVPAGGRAGLGAGPAGGRRVRSSAPAPSGSCPARSPPTRVRCPPRSARPRRRVRAAVGLPRALTALARGCGRGPRYGRRRRIGSAAWLSQTRCSPRSARRAVAGARRGRSPTRSRRRASPRPSDVTADRLATLPKVGRQSAPTGCCPAGSGSRTCLRGGPSWWCRPACGPGSPRGPSTPSATTPPAGSRDDPWRLLELPDVRVGRGRPGGGRRAARACAGTTRAAAGRWSAYALNGRPGTGTPCSPTHLVARRAGGRGRRRPAGRRRRRGRVRRRARAPGRRTAATAARACDAVRDGRGRGRRGDRPAGRDRGAARRRGRRGGRWATWTTPSAAPSRRSCGTGSAC